MKRSQIARILSRNKGSKAELARRAGVKNNVVSMWLAGGPNKRLGDLAEAYAKELLEKEELARLSKGEANGPSARTVVDQIRKHSSEGKE